mmetsp:Transcript_6569/g.17629  ORF Transcript_6569/g.17629 Transcript_6569/m.17629 type:complete len:599 (-) Transcript_6569:131-1927(-)
MCGLWQHVKDELRSHARPWLVNAVLLGVGYCVLLAILGNEVLPYAALWSLLLVWFCALVAGLAFRTLTLPALLGQLLVGMLLQNLPGELLRGLRRSWVGGVRTMALSFVLMRAGLGMNVQEVCALGWRAVVFALVPGLCESFVVGALSVPFFGFPWALSMANGFIVGAVSAAVVVVEILDLGARYEGLGQVHGVKTLLVFAVTADIVLAVSGYTLCSGLAYGTGSLVWNILFGPVNVIAGIGAGLVVGALLWLTAIVRSDWKTVALLVGSNVAIVFAFQSILFTGAAAVSAVLIPIVAVVGWKQAYPSPWINKHAPRDAEAAAELASDERDSSPHTEPMDDQVRVTDENVRPTLLTRIEMTVVGLLARVRWLHSEKHPEYASLSSKIANFVWAVFVAPALFGTIGTALDFDLMTGETVGKAIGLIVIGVVVRIFTGWVTQLRSPLTNTERYYVSISMASKATIQAALGGLPLAFYSEQPDATAEELLWSRQILTISTLSILLTAPAGTYLMRTMGPRWLTPPQADVDAQDQPSVGVSSASQLRLEGGPRGSSDRVAHGGHVAERIDEKNGESGATTTSGTRDAPEPFTRSSLSSATSQ